MFHYDKSQTWQEIIIQIANEGNSVVDIDYLRYVDIIKRLISDCSKFVKKELSPKTQSFNVLDMEFRIISSLENGLDDIFYL